MTGAFDLSGRREDRSHVFPMITPHDTEQPAPAESWSVYTVFCLLFVLGSMAGAAYIVITGLK